MQSVDTRQDGNCWHRSAGYLVAARMASFTLAFMWRCCSLSHGVGAVVRMPEQPADWRDIERL